MRQHTVGVQTPDSSWHGRRSLAGRLLGVALVVVAATAGSPPAAAPPPPDPQPLARLDGAGGGVAVYSADGGTILTAGGTEARAWDARSFKPRSAVLGHDDPIRSAVVAGDGSRVATAAGRVATLWDVAAGKPLVALPHAERVLDVALSPDGKQLATACADGRARVWDVSTGKAVMELKHDHPVRSVAFSPDGRSLLTGTVIPDPNNLDRPPAVDHPEAGGDVFLWDLRTGANGWDFVDGHERCAGRPVFSPDGRRVGLPAGHNGAIVVDATNGKRLAWYRGVTWGRYHVAFARDGTRLVAAGRDGSSVVDAAAYALELEADRPGVKAEDRDFALLAKFLPNTVIRSAAISPDGRWVALTTGGQTVLGDVPAKPPAADPEPDARPGRTVERDDVDEALQTVVALSPDGARLLVGHVETRRGNGRAVPTGKTYTEVWPVPLDRPATP